MSDLEDGQSVEMQGSGAKPYVLKNVGGVYSCTCPAWRNQSVGIERRTCKHLRKLRGDAAEEARLGGALPQRPAKADGDEGAAGPPLLLANSWDNAMDLSGWWMSEKLDGVRAYWDGKQFLSRQGNVYYAPDWFIDGLPGVPLDGELWIDRKKFQRTVGIVRRQDKSDLWKEVRFVAFDAPASGGAFEERMQFLKEALGGGAPKFARIHDQQLCTGIDMLRAELARVESLGGEGLMLRQPGSKYETGRSATLLKIKSFRDAEATVIGHQPGAGRHKGRLGALLVRLPGGVEFSVGTGFSDRQRSAPPPIGASITFRYQELSDGGVPRFPSYVGLRAEGTVAPSGSGPAPVAPAAAAAPDSAPGQGSAQPRSDAGSEARRRPGSDAADSSATKPAGKVAKAPSQDRADAPAAGRGQQARRLNGAAAPAPPAAPRRFEFVEGTSSKFWEVSCSGADLTTRWGRIGSAGQSKTKPFPDPAAAVRQMAKLVAEKTAEGYRETTKE